MSTSLVRMKLEQREAIQRQLLVKEFPLVMGRSHIRLTYKICAMYG